MWVVIVQYEFESDIFIYDDLEKADSRYMELKNSGQVVFLTSVIKSNI